VRRLGEILSLALALAIIVALGLYVSRPNGTLVPIAASPTPAGSTFAPIPTGSASPPAPTATPKTASDHAVVYFARDGAAPVAAAVPGAGIGASAAARIASRIEQLRGADAPPGAINAYPGRGIPIVLGKGAADVTISGDLATIDFTVPGSDWIVRGAGLARALIQQLVFTATEEPGIRRVRITENGGKDTVIDQIVLDAPMSREDVNGHEEASREAVDGGDADTADGDTFTTTWSVDTVAPGLTRFVVQVNSTGSTTAPLPQFRIEPQANDEVARPNGGKWTLSVAVWSDGTTPNGTAIIDRTPFRSITTSTTKVIGAPDKATIYELGLDDLRPWRVFTLANPTRIVVDFGGQQAATSDRIAVYGPVVGSTINRTFILSGAARVFEANVVWRVKDNRQRVLADGNTLATLGTSAVWGTFQTTVTLPATATGNVTIEVFEVSPRDGSEVGAVSFGAVIR
jgi:hypothetical protein